MNTIMIVSGESSGELYGSLLAKELKNRCPGVYITGVGGERMDKAGVELISSTSDAFGLIEAVSAYGKVKAAFSKTVHAIKRYNPDVLVLIDYPDFNIKVAGEAKAFGTKILYYVSPQVCAWRKGRVKKIASIVDRMAVILPFEEKIYRKAGVKCEFVGRPDRRSAPWAATLGSVWPGSTGADSARLGRRRRWSRSADRRRRPRR